MGKQNDKFVAAELFDTRFLECFADVLKSASAADPPEDVLAQLMEKYDKREQAKKGKRGPTSADLLMKKGKTKSKRVDASMPADLVSIFNNPLASPQADRRPATLSISDLMSPAKTEPEPTPASTSTSVDQRDAPSLGKQITPMDYSTSQVADTPEPANAQGFDEDMVGDSPAPSKPSSDPAPPDEQHDLDGFHIQDPEPPVDADLSYSYSPQPPPEDDFHTQPRGPSSALRFSDLGNSNYDQGVSLDDELQGHLSQDDDFGESQHRSHFEPAAHENGASLEDELQGQFDDHADNNYNPQHGNFDQQHDNYDQQHDNYDQQHDNYDQQRDNYDQQHDNYDQQHDNYDQQHDNYDQQVDNLDQQHDNYDQQHDNYDQQHDNFDQQHDNFDQQHDNFDQQHDNFDQQHDNYDQQHDNYDQQHDNYDQQHDNYDQQLDNLDQQYDNYDQQHDNYDQQHDNYAQHTAASLEQELGGQLDADLHHDYSHTQPQNGHADDMDHLNTTGHSLDDAAVDGLIQNIIKSHNEDADILDAAHHQQDHSFHLNLTKAQNADHTQHHEHSHHNPTRHEQHTQQHGDVAAYTVDNTAVQNLKRLPRTTRTASTPRVLDRRRAASPTQARPARSSHQTQNQQGTPRPIHEPRSSAWALAGGHTSQHHATPTIHHFALPQPSVPIAPRPFMNPTVSSCLKVREKFHRKRVVDSHKFDTVRSEPGHVRNAYAPQFNSVREKRTRDAPAWTGIYDPRVSNESDQPAAGVPSVFHRLYEPPKTVQHQKLQPESPVSSPPRQPAKLRPRTNTQSRMSPRQLVPQWGA